jgi:hemerythrin-like metal-binding protein
MPEIRGVIDRLAAYTVEHFRDEEAILRKAGYAALEDHEMIHAELLEKVQDLRTKLEKHQAVSMVGIIRFLSDWLKDHILQDDMAYKSSIKGIG